MQILKADSVYLTGNISNYEKFKEKANIEGEHYLLSNNDFSAMSARFQISGIPRYILVDKEGRVFSEKAKRPSDSELKKEIEELLAAK